MVAALRNNCTNSDLTLVLPDSSNAILPSEAFTVTNDTEFRHVSISLQADSISTTFNTGNYTFEVWEVDWFSGFIAKTRFEVRVAEEELEPFTGVIIVE